MQELRNPFSDMPGYNCFGCSPHNESGLKMKFRDEGEYVTSIWMPGNDFQGYHNTLHGGIIATLLDELASWTIMVKLKTSGVTSKMEIEYLKPVRLEAGETTLRGKISDFRHKIAVVQTELFNGEKMLAAKAKVSYYIFPESVAREKYNYPGPESFYR